MLAAITWVGSAIYAQALATKIVREGDPVHLATTAKDVGDLAKRLILPASVAVLGFGVWLVAVSPGPTRRPDSALGGPTDLAALEYSIVSYSRRPNRSRDEHTSLPVTREDT